MPVILLIDDDVKLTESIVLNVAEDRYDWHIANNGEDGLKLVESIQPDLVVSDIRMPNMDGITLLKKVKELHPELPVVMITAYEDMETTIKAMQMGAFEYVRKPIDPDELELIIDRALETVKKHRQLKRVVREISAKYRMNNLVGSTPAMQEIFKTIGQVTTSNVSVLINGESGTGKELIAKAVHYNSPKHEEPFIAINCSAIPEGLIESELFGHEKGSFTGAIATSQGKFEQCEDGTLFLDEIGDMPVNMQVKLLRVLQEREFIRVGGMKKMQFTARVIAATHRDLESMVAEGKFREDLYYRLAVVKIEVPPLRERRDDVPRLSEFLIDKINHEIGSSIKRIAPETMDALKDYKFSGNVRELENILRHAIVMAKGDMLLPEYLPELSGELGSKSGTASGDGCTFPSKILPMEEIERRYILHALQLASWKKKLVCEKLEIARTTLDRKIEQYEIKMPGK
jgi:DNA-binding NtrC family response regulator